MMTCMVEKVRRQIEEAVTGSLKKAAGEGKLPATDIPGIIIEKPREAGHGDFSTNIAMIMARQARMAPVRIAEIIKDGIDTDGLMIKSIEVAGPGFLNFFLDDEWLRLTLGEIIEKGDAYGNLDIGKGKKVMVEFVSANPTGPLHMGNARGGALGDLIAEVLEKSGHEVVREYYVNDAGNQIEKFAQSLELRYIQEKKGEEAVEFPEDCYQGEDIRDHVREYIAVGKEDLMEKDSGYRKEKLVGYALPKNLENIKKVLARYGIEFDNWFSEQSLYDSGEVDETISYLKENGHTTEKDGALWLKGESIGSE
jgi:arginyl-tRNA synthetase